MEAYLGDIWFFLWGLLWGIYFALGGYDFGLGLLLPVLGLGSEKERNTMHLAAAPFWDGNQVWLITAGGVTFAAFPLAYAVMFSSLYTALLLLLLMLIIRSVAAELRPQSLWSVWRKSWDCLGAGAAFLAALLLGVAFSNIFRGLPLDADHVFQGCAILGLTSNTLSLLHPYCLLGGLLFVVMFAVHGALYLSWRVGGDLSAKSLLTARVLWPVFLILFLLYVVLTFAWAGLWVNYAASPLLLILPLACALAFLAGGCQLYRAADKAKAAFICHGLGIITLTLTGVMGIYPNLLPSRLSPAGALTIANASSSPKTLAIMLGVAVVFVPLVILYQWWAHRRLSQRLSAEYE
ncbi:MAG: cytochrome d ubiquinol oxidase subunit II [Candidatus Adiutrix sp.]|jgi:cytochrome d ubiquinol oxidase subunit II|nr:cytochrome d ubiquinol oxidase subunit II [Candidatus Adiutrix sp.]